MKIRQGFVSNSSSTSFLIAICNSADEKDLLMFEMFEKSFPGWDEITNCQKAIKATGVDYKNEMEIQLEGLKEDLAFSKKEIKKVTELLKDDKVLVALETYQTAIEQSNVTQRRLHKAAFKRTPKQVFENEIYMFKNAIKRCEDKIAEIQKDLDLIEAISKNKSIKCIFKFEVNNGFGMNRFIRQLEILQEIGIIEVLRKETT